MADTPNRPNEPKRETPIHEKESEDPSRRREGQQGGQQGRPSEKSGTSEREREGTETGGTSTRNRPEGDVEGVSSR
ncbi:MAG TPA: hypothetical protein VFO52_11770 [Longimicrobiales bacterium]|nr:hypothetical protein [Longimicrobiales bacterium]